MPLDPQAKIILEEDAARDLPAYYALTPPAARKQMLDLSTPVNPLLMALHEVVGTLKRVLKVN